MEIPFSLPLIDESVVAEVVDALTGTGWITSGPKVQEFERQVAQLTLAPATVAVNSWTAGAMVVLRWFGVGPGDEVIVPAYTYCATALAVMNVGATPVMVDIDPPFHISIDQIGAAISPKTKAIIPVDLGGLPCEYGQINGIVESEHVKRHFGPRTERQSRLGRPLVLADAAHSLGGAIGTSQVGTLADVSVFSFHSVKNLTTGEGGMICLNLPAPFDNESERRAVKYLALNGQTKSALEKSQVGGWKYDIVEQGLKANMPDICAAIGLAQLRKYKQTLLPERRAIFNTYNEVFEKHEWAILPPMSAGERESSLHLYQLRIKDADEVTRNRIINHISDQGIGVNVHYVPMPMLTLFRRLGYDISDYPNSFSMYENEITLPVYNNLRIEDVRRVASAVVNAYQTVSVRGCNDNGHRHQII